MISQHKLLAEALRLGFGTAKEMAAAGGISVQSAIRYRRGETYPDVFTIARLMRQSRVVAEAVLRMAGLDDVWLDQEQARLLRELIDLQQRRAPYVAAAMAAAENSVAGAQVTPARAGGPTPAPAVAARLR